MRITWRSVLCVCAETKLTCSQTSEVAVSGDVVNYTCEINYHGVFLPGTSMLIWGARHRYSSSGTSDFSTSVSIERTTISFQMPDGGAIVSPGCRVRNTDPSWSADYTWRSTAIRVACQYICAPLPLPLITVAYRGAG